MHAAGTQSLTASYSLDRTQTTYSRRPGSSSASSSTLDSRNASSLLIMSYRSMDLRNRVAASTVLVTVAVLEAKPPADGAADFFLAGFLVFAAMAMLETVDTSCRLQMGGPRGPARS